MISRAVLFDRMLGREAELERLVALRDQSALDGRVCLATIRGDAGIGKSRLVVEFGRHRASVRNVFLHVRCQPEGAASYAPIVDALEEIVRANSRNERARSALQTLRSTDGDDISPEEAVRRRLVSIADAFATEAKRRGHLTIAVDDVHWSDTETIAALRFLVRRGDLPVLIVVTYRHDDLVEPFRLKALAELEREGADRIVLGPLHERDQLALLKTALPATPDTVLRRIAELAEGQPFFAEELARSAAGGRSAADVPLTLRAAILGRVADLSRDARDVLRCAALLGPRFTFEDLAALSGSDVAALVATLGHARDRQILIEEERDGRVRFRFRHALTQAVFLGEMLAVERRALHRKVADLIERSGDADRIDELAYHRWASRDAAPAVIACEAAGDAAMRSYAFNDAARWFERALEFAADDADFARLSQKRLDALIDGGAVDALAPHCERMSARLTGTGLEDAAARAACAAARAFTLVQRVRDAAAMLDSDVVVRSALRDAEIRFERNLALAWVAVRRSQGDAATFEALDAVEDDAREQGTHAQARLLHARQSASLFQTDPEQVALITKRATALAIACGDHRLQAKIAVNYAIYEHFFSLDRAIPLILEAAAIFDSRGDAFAASHALSNLAALLISAGKLAEGAALVRQAEKMSLLSNSWLGAEVFLACLTGGDLQRFVAMLEPERFDGSAWVAYVTASHVSRALPPVEAQALIRSALPFVIQRPAGIFAVSVALRGDDASRAAVRDGMRDYVPQNPYALANFKLFSAISLRREGRRLAARDAAREAIAAYLSCGHVTSGLAEAYVEAGEPEQAVELLKRVGATAALARLHRDLGNEPHETTTILSQREAQIARLAVMGKSNREAGLHLGISARTVDTHMNNVYRKLHVSSRLELAAKLEQLKFTE